MKQNQSHLLFPGSCTSDPIAYSWIHRKLGPFWIIDFLDIRLRHGTPQEIKLGKTSSSQLLWSCSRSGSHFSIYFPQSTMSVSQSFTYTFETLFYIGTIAAAETRAVSAESHQNLNFHSL